MTFVTLVEFPLDLIDCPWRAIRLFTMATGGNRWKLKEQNFCHEKETMCPKNACVKNSYFAEDKTCPRQRIN